MQRFLAVVATFSLAACAYDGAGYPKPEYNHIGQAGDPEFFLESQFGTSTQFKAKLDAAPDDDCVGTQRVAYLQAMNSFFRRPDAPGPWKFVAPAGKPVLIAGQWVRYSTSGFDYLSKTNLVFPGGSCPWAAKTMIPQAGATYLVRLSGVGPTCELSIKAADGSPVETHDAPNCARPQ